MKHDSVLRSREKPFHRERNSEHIGVNVVRITDEIILFVNDRRKYAAKRFNVFFLSRLSEDEEKIPSYFLFLV